MLPHRQRTGPTAGQVARGAYSQKRFPHLHQRQAQSTFTLLQNYLDQLEIEFINRVMNIKNRSLREIMVESKGCFALEETALVTEELIREISQKEHSFIPVYVKEKDNIVGYVSSKEVIIRYLAYKKKEVLTLKKLAQGKIVYKSVKIYSDAVAIEALSVV